MTRSCGVQRGAGRGVAGAAGRRRPGRRRPGAAQEIADVRPPAAGAQHLRRPPGHPGALDPARARGPARRTSAAGLDHLQLAPRLDKSVRATLQLSYEDCTASSAACCAARPDQRPRRARLGGGELLATSEPDGADQLEALIDTQLAECSGIDFAGVMRYRLHDLVRIFARERPTGRDDGSAGWPSSGSSRATAAAPSSAVATVAAGLGRRARPADPRSAEQTPELGGRLAQRRAADPGRRDRARPEAWRCGSWPGASAGRSARSATP